MVSVVEELITLLGAFFIVGVLLFISVSEKSIILIFIARYVHIVNKLVSSINQNITGRVVVKVVDILHLECREPL